MECPEMISAIGDIQAAVEACAHLETEDECEAAFRAEEVGRRRARVLDRIQDRAADIGQRSRLCATRTWGRRGDRKTVPRCQRVLAGGQCRHRAHGGTDFCWQHQATE